MSLSDIIVRAWDDSRNSQQAKFVGAIEIVPGTEQSLEFGGKLDDQQEPNPIMDSEPSMSMEALNDWAGFSSNNISDSEFLSHIGVDGEKIPSWFKNSKIAKWVQEGMLTQQEFVNALKFLDKQGFL